MTTKNPAIGEIACPIPGCNRKAAVCQFKASHQRDSGRRLGGKLYAKCPAHGRIGFDGADAMQDWILNNARMYSPEAKQELTADQARALEAEPLLPVPDGDELDDDAPPAAEPPAAAVTPPAKKGGFGFFS